MAAVPDKKNGKWKADYYDECGKRRIKTGFPSKKDAQAYIDARKEKHPSEQLAVMSKNFITYTYRKLAEEYNDEHLSKTDGKSNCSYIKGTVKKWGDYKLSSISPGEVKRWIRKLLNEPNEKGFFYAVATVEKYLSYMKTVFNWGREFEIIDQNPIEKVKFTKEFKKKNIRNETMNEEQFKEFYSLFDNSQWYIKGPLLMLWHTGMRIGEVLGLKWSDVKFDEALIVLAADRVKERSVRTIGLEQEVLDLLGELKAINNKKGSKGKDHVFGVTGQKPLGYQTFWNNYRKIVDGTGFEKFKAHDQRHCYTKLRRQWGFDPEIIMVQQGHKSRSMFDRYNDTDIAEVQEMAGFNKDQRHLIVSEVDQIKNKMEENGIGMGALCAMLRK